MQLKKIALFIFLLFFTFSTTFGQSKSKTIFDQSGQKILAGEISMQQLVDDTAFRWFYQGINNYKPDAKMLKYISFYRDSISIIAFLGTWEEESQKTIPQLYRTLLASSFPINKVQLYGVNEDLKSLNNKMLKWNVKKIPTILVLDQKGVEIGRIVEIPLKSVEYNLAVILQNHFLK